MGNVIDFHNARQEVLIKRYIELWKLGGAESALNYMADLVDHEELEYIVNEAIDRVNNGKK